MKVCPACALVYPDETTFCFLTGDTLQPAGDAVVGTTIGGRFSILSKLSDGPWATQYNASFRLLDKPCVAKIFNEPLNADDQKAFQQALLGARRCTHDNVSAVWGGGILPDGRGYVVHEHLEATPLSAMIARGAMPPPQAFAIIAQMLRALGRIHDFGAVHGSMSPTNVLVTQPGHAQIVEVGLGRGLLNDPFADDPRALFAQRYIAPELSSTQRTSANADLYAVGAIATHMLTGQPPFEAGAVSELRTKVNEQGIDVDGRLQKLDERLRTWLKMLIDRNPEGRHANAHLAVEALEEACEAAGVKMLPDPGRTAPAEPSLASGFGRWERFRDVFTKMVETGFPSGAPAQVSDALAQIASRVEAMGELAKKAKFEHGNLDDIGKRAREGRGTIADQMDTVNVSAKEVRLEVQPLKVAAARHGDKAKDFPAAAREAHKEVMRWEGRSALVEPYKELADAYANIADIMTRWWEVRSAQLTCERDAAEKNEELHAFDEQLEELRKALTIHESNLAAEGQATEEAIAKLGVDADRLEMELLDLASRFSAPLRSKPELGAQFRELANLS